MNRHRLRRLLAVSGDQAFNDCEVLARLFAEPVIIVPAPVVLPREVAEGAEKDLEPAEFLGEERIAAACGDGVMEPAINVPGRVDKSRQEGVVRPHQPAQVGLQTFEDSRVDPPARATHRLTFKRAADVADFADLVFGDPTDDRPAIRQKVNNADPGKRDQGLSDRRMADAKAFGQSTRDEMLTRSQTTMEDVVEQPLHDRPPTLTVIAIQRPLAHADSQGADSIRGEERQPNRSPVRGS